MKNDFIIALFVEINVFSSRAERKDFDERFFLYIDKTPFPVVAVKTEKQARARVKLCFLSCTFEMFSILD